MGFYTFIERTGAANCCPWCAGLVGKWTIKNAPKDVFGCHDNCTCMVEYTNSRGVTSQSVGGARFVEVEYEPTRLTDGAGRGAGEPKRLTGGANGGKIDNSYKMSADLDFTLNGKTYKVKKDPDAVTKAINYAKDVLHAGIVNFAGVKNGEVIQPLLEQLAKLQEKHDNNFFQMFVHEMDEHVFAEVAPDLGLHLNSRYINSKEALADFLGRMNNKRLVPKGHADLEYLITHEYMHFISRSDVDNPRSKLHKYVPSDEKKRNKHLPSVNSSFSKAEYVADAMAMVEFGAEDSVWNKIYSYYFGNGDESK